TPDDTTTPPAEDEGPAEFQPSTFDYDEIYASAFPGFEEMMTIAKNSDNTADERLAYMAAAEARLLSGGALAPYTTQGGNYAISRGVNRTIPSVLWGSDSDRYESAFATTEFVKSEDMTALRNLWNEVKGTGTYVEQAKAYLAEHGYEIADSYNTIYTSDPTTWDVMATFQSVNTEWTCNTLDGLLKYDVENVQQFALATSYEVSDDGLTYTFHIREGVKWVDSQGREVDDVQADDWVASMQHVFDCGGGQEELLTGVIVGAEEYVLGEYNDMSQVGVKAVDKYTLEYTLVEPFPVFPTMMGYCGVFGPLCRSYYEAQGGKFGSEFDDTAENYTYGKTPNNIAYCGPYLITNWTEKNIIVFQANPSYWNAENVVNKTINIYYISGDDPLQTYNMAKDGQIVGAGLNATAAKQAQEDGLFDDYHYQGATTATSFVGFFNLARRAYANAADATKMVSPQSHESADAIDVDAGVVTSDILDDAARTHAAISNNNFRLAMDFANDRGAVNAQAVGEDLKYARLRNSYVPADFASIEEDTTVTVDGKSYSFPAGSYYGEMLQAFMDALGVPAMVWNPDLNGGSGDGYDGWYNPENAKAYMEKAVAELAAQGVEVSKENPIQIDYTYPANDPNYVNQSQAYKQSIENVLGDYVVINLIGGNSYDEWYDTGYNVYEGYDMNFDIAFISGWSPDYGDAACYLDTVLPQGAGYTTASMGLW
ncbi:MAG: peptide ABC transporter substrate-binding protein, partial [Oscillospiraceae bacterium]|nr:peptide ABC transporter substrate-binding protein [Oscillospiraceae bacterium]